MLLHALDAPSLYKTWIKRTEDGALGERGCSCKAGYDHVMHVRQLHTRSSLCTGALKSNESGFKEEYGDMKPPAYEKDAKDAIMVSSFMKNMLGWHCR